MIAMPRSNCSRYIEGRGRQLAIPPVPFGSSPSAYYTYYKGHSEMPGLSGVISVSEELLEQRCDLVLGNFHFNRELLLELCELTENVTL